MLENDKSSPLGNPLSNALRALTIDAIEISQSGHPGAPMGMADIADVLWRRHLKHNPSNPKWFNRDRFVLSNGHGSMLLYSLLHLSGYDVSIEDLKKFRQFGSRTPGHPEYGYTPGVETTTGPLGQGFANGVGMALGEKILAARYNTPRYPVVDHHTYVFLGDGCLMEGISHEAASLAGTWKLNKLIAFYDDNGISIDGRVSGWFSEDVKKRFSAYGWNVIVVEDGHDPGAIDKAVINAKASREKPSLVICKTIIGYGSPHKGGTHNCHGAPLGPEESQATKDCLGWKYPPFEIPQEIYQAWDCRSKGDKAEAQWNSLVEDFEKEDPAKYREFNSAISGELPQDFETVFSRLLAQVIKEQSTSPSRKSSWEVLNVLGPAFPQLLGGSADLAPSNLTKWNGSTAFSGENPEGNYIHYGVREFGMAAIMNGLALHGGFIPYGGTFLMFYEYARNALRMAALMGIQTIYVFTHDSIGLGEDGPTHQPVEQIASLRATPNLNTWRPCDSVETVVAWKASLGENTRPSALILSRQSLPFQQRPPTQVEEIRKGGYILWEPKAYPAVILLSSGSEVALAVKAAHYCASQGIAVRVVSMPCMEVFEEQPLEYRERVIPTAITKRIAVEAAVPDPWYKYVGIQGRVLGISRFGESAPGDSLMEYFGFTEDNLVSLIRTFL